jgi:hypothetical protein
VQHQISFFFLVHRYHAGTIRLSQQVCNSCRSPRTSHH